MLGRLYGLIERDLRDAPAATAGLPAPLAGRPPQRPSSSRGPADGAARHVLGGGSPTGARAPLYRCFRRRVRLQRLTLRVDRLESPAEQLSLFDESASRRARSHRLSLALDSIRAKFGEQAVSWGRTLR